MIPGESLGSPPVAAWRRPWVVLAGLVFVAQVLAFWGLAPGGNGAIRRTLEPGRDRFLPEPDGLEATRTLENWSWLLSPAVFLLPTELGFSGAAWMRANPGDLEVEAFDVAYRPLPWERACDSMRVQEVQPSLDPGPAGGWGTIPEAVDWPKVAPVPLPSRSEVRVLSGLRGRPILSGALLDVPSDGRIALARAVVVRVTVDETGELSAPPVVWESSEVPAADEAAVKAARRLVFAPVGAGAGLESGLVRVEWAVGSGAAPGKEGAR